MTPDDIQAAVITQIRAWEQGEAEGVANGFTHDGEIVIPGKVMKGHDALRASVTHFTRRYTDVKVTVHRILCGEDSAAVEYRWEDTERDTGIRAAADDAVWVDFRDGLIARWREYWDHKTPLQ